MYMSTVSVPDSCEVHDWEPTYETDTHVFDAAASVGPTCTSSLVPALYHVGCPSNTYFLSSLKHFGPYIYC